MISHELAHMWFGNLVTLKWWDDLWLNEGFANYIEYIGAANYHPDWELEAQFNTDDLHPAMELDASAESHPIIQEVNDPDQITEIFDSITYKKGCSVIRMLENFMGAEEFKKGIHNFLESHKFSGAISRHEKSIQISTKAIIATGKLAPKRSIKMPKISAKRLILA